MRVVRILIFLATCPVLAQQEPARGADLQEMKEELHELMSTLQATQVDLRRAEHRIESLQDEVTSLRAATIPVTPMPPLEERVSNLQQQHQLLATRVDQQYQTKVESGSKYRVQLSGLILFNAGATRGTVDDQDVPMLAERTPLGTSNGNVTATMRQTLMNVDVFGPELAGARTSGHVQFDFFGGAPNTVDGAAMGILRMRVATAKFEWDKWSLAFGQDKPFVSPNSPTSLAAIGTPEFGYSGNLWTWTPQIVGERRWDFDGDLEAKVQFGMLDPFTGEFPYSNFSRSPEPGELSRTPAFAVHPSFSYGPANRRSSIGVGGYTARHDFGFGRTVTGWAGTADWKVMLGPLFEISGEVYRGRAIGGLWGGIGNSAVFNGDPNDRSSRVFPVNTIGGWSQLKYKATSTWEFNGGLGEDSPFARDVRLFNEPGTAYSPYLRNWSTMFNVIHHPRSNLMLSLEYRHLNTVDFNGKAATAENVNLGVGVSF